MISYKAQRCRPHFALPVAFSCILAHLAAEELAADVTAEATKVPVLLQWAQQPELCLGVPESVQSGFELVLVPCDGVATYQKFLVPTTDQPGLIRPMANLQLCLDAPGGRLVQVWDCLSAPSGDILWQIDAEGHVHLASRGGVCLAVLRGRAIASRTLQVSECTAAFIEATSFRVQTLGPQQGASAKQRDPTDPVHAPAPSECRWSSWSSWTGCSGSCGETGEKARHRTVEMYTESGGSRCDLAASAEWAPCGGYCAEVRGEKQDGVVEDPPGVEDVVAAAMMFGCIIFMIALFYLVNHHDGDIKRYAWQVISKTLSIFCAVLVYSGADTIFQKLIRFLTSVDHPMKVSVIEVCLWFVILHTVLRTKAQSKAIAKQTGSRQEIEDTSLSLSCALMLHSHMTGFAVIFAGLRICKELGDIAPVLRLLSVLIFALALQGVFIILDSVRHHSDPTTSIQKEMVEIWEEATEDAENEIASIGLSFILAKVIVDIVELTVKPIETSTEGRLLGRHLRAHAHGHTGNSELSEEVTDLKDTETSLKVLLWSLAFAMVTVVFVYIGDHFGRHKFSSENGRATMKQWIWRWFFIVQSMCAMTFAWLLGKVVSWEMARSAQSLGLAFDAEGVPERVVAAVAISLMSVGLIFLLDYIEDLEATPELVDRCLRGIIVSLSIMIGFGWEEAFESGMEVIAESSQGHGSEYTMLVKLLLGLAVLAIVMPAWRWYILRMALSFEEASEGAHAYVPCTVLAVEEGRSPRQLVSHKHLVSHC